jgi:hypothetical protein
MLLFCDTVFFHAPTALMYANRAIARGMDTLPIFRKCPTWYRPLIGPLMSQLAQGARSLLYLRFRSRDLESPIFPRSI